MCWALEELYRLNYDSDRRAASRVVYPAQAAHYMELRGTKSCAGGYMTHKKKKLATVLIASFLYLHWCRRDESNTIGRGLAALNSRDGFDGFLFYVMQYFKTVFDRRNSEGTTFGSITKDDLHSLPLAYPPTELLMEYDKVVSGYNQMVFTRSMENQHLAQLRDWLLPMLINGQVSVL